MHKQREKKKISISPPSDNICPPPGKRKHVQSFLGKANIVSNECPPWNIPLATLGQLGVSPPTTFPFLAYWWEVECWRDSSDAVPALLILAKTGWNQHPPLVHKHICMCVASLSRCPDVSQSHQAINSSHFCSQSKSAYFTFGNLIYLLFVSMFFSGVTLGHVSIYVMSLQSHVFYFLSSSFLVKTK